MAPADDDLWALCLAPDFEDVGLDPRSSLQSFVGDALRRRHQGLGITEVENQVAMVGLLHEARDEVALAAFVEVEYLLTLGVAEALQNHLLGGLRGDSSEVIRGVFPLADDIAVFI